ncbi:MAG: hypothetical protein AVDCRST_MAG56-408 [uncultured Cytophagales bacterium]|uniref:T9SS type A sorting domain-containing protein n=1 Tax=uncultured Cytophagales bacterium TaxID=158755 RepID=A0A6J4HCD4_9SPHI|nr:MAG: hypothetical protein AVDCRST_MAG56-408 [uncultured Cytophagales bacterium]
MKNHSTPPASPFAWMTRPVRPAHCGLLMLLLALLPATPGRAQSYAWSTKIGNSAYNSSVSADDSGNTYVTTNFSGTFTVGSYTFTSRGGLDICLIKYNAAGAVQWARRIGSTGNDYSGDVSVSVISDNVFVSGSFESTVVFGSYHGYDVSPLNSSGGSDIFVARYMASTGSLNWARRAGGTGDDDGNGIFVDGSDNVFVTGSFTGTLFYSGGLFIVPLFNSGLTDIFLAKFNSAGSTLWFRGLGGGGYDAGSAVAVDKYNGDIYLTGGVAPVSNLYVTDAVVAKYNSGGTLQWQRTAGTGGYIDRGHDVIVTASGAYVTGYFGSSVTFGSTTLTSAGSSDAFVVHYPYSGGGTAAWAKRFGGSGWDEGESIAQVGSYLYVGGIFGGTATFGHTTLNALGGASDRDMFVTSLYMDGSPAWTRRIGSTGYDYGRGSLASPRYSSTPYFTGSYGSPITLGSTTLSGSGNLLTKITPPVLPTVASFRLINANTDADLGAIAGFSEINYQVIGTNKINIRVTTNPGTVGSVRLNLDGVTKTENAAPYTWAGDAPKAGGGTDYYAFTPSLGGHRLEVTPYSGANGTGVKGPTQILFFTVTNKPAITSLTLYNAVTDASLGNLVNGQTIVYSNIGTNQINIRANTAPGTVGSVRFVLDWVTKTENAAPYTWAGDAPKTGGTNYYAFTPGVGYHHLVVTPYSGTGGTGTAGTPYEIYFYVQNGAGRLAAEATGPEATDQPFAVAPNPFADRTSLSFTATTDGPARLEVYSPTGTRVRLLFEGSVESGKKYAYAFDGTGLPPGVYVGRLTTGNGVAHRKLLLNR